MSSRLEAGGTSESVFPDRPRNRVGEAQASLGGEVERGLTGRRPGPSEEVQHNRWASPSSASFLPVPVLLGLMLLAHFAVGPSVYFDPAWLILLGNTLGVTLVSLVVCYVALRNYQATGRLQILLLGCGVLIFGTGGVLAAIVRGLPDGANLNVTIYNTGAVLGGSFHLMAAFFLLAGVSPETGSKRRGPWLLLGYAGVALFMAALTAASLGGKVPRFFVQGVGPTALRQRVLGTADLLFLFSFLIFLGSYLRTREPFLYWYAGALALTCISLTAFFIERSVGSPVGWVGRVSQYVGGVYFLISLMTAARTAQRRGTTLDDVLTASLSGAEERFRALAENSPDAIHRFDRERNPLYVNVAGRRLFGSPAGALIGKPMEQVGLPEAQAKVLTDAVGRVFETDKPVEVEVELPTRGGVRYLESRCVAEYGPRGEVANVLMVSRDITERKRAVAALGETQERTTAILQGIADTFYSLDRDWRFTVVNPAAEKAPFARPAAELLGKSIWELYPGLVGTPIHQHYQDAAEKLALEHYVAQSPLNGRWYEVFLQGWKGGVDVYMRDVTERKQAEEALRRGKELSDALIRLGEAAHASLDFDEISRRLVEEGARALGSDSAALALGVPEGWKVHCVHGMPHDLVGTVMDDEQVRHGVLAVETGQPVAVADVPNDPRSGPEHLLRDDVRSVLAVPLIAMDRPLGLVFFNYHAAPHCFAPSELDFARQLGATASIALQNARLYHERREAEEALLEADRRKNEFLAVLSHELRNPLAPIANSLCILDHAPLEGDRANRAKQVIGRQVAQLSNLVNDLLDVTRITRNKVQLRKERLELNEVVRRAVDDNRSFFEQAAVRLELAPAPRPLFVLADRTRVTQVVCNLLQNSAKFTSKGGRTRVSVAAEGSEAVLGVADDGVGMSRETLARLFQPFMQADQTLDRSKGGLGLGLALVKGLVELHGGSVWAQSAGLGKGTEFTVRLPLDTRVELEPAAARAEMGWARARRRVFIIEDNVDAADSLREALELGDHEVMVAYNGHEALARARAFEPDVVLCDIGLPGMDGYEVARAIRADDVLKETFLVALSGYASPEDLQRAAQAGFERHLAKPPSIEKLEALLAEAPQRSSEELPAEMH